MVSKDQPGSAQIRILLADDHPQVRDQLAARLRREPDFDLVGVAANSRSAMQITLAAQPDVLLIDPMMRDGMGLATVRRLVAENPSLAVVVLTAIIDTTLELQLQSLGVKNSLAKGVSTLELLAELRSAAIA